MAKKPKVITICGSLKFQDQMISSAEQLELQGHCVFNVTFPTHDRKTREKTKWYSDQEVQLLDRLHKHKIDLADAIFVVNVDGYIGASTQSEIAYAQKTGKEIIYLEPIKN